MMGDSKGTPKHEYNIIYPEGRAESKEWSEALIDSFNRGDWSEARCRLSSGPGSDSEADFVVPLQTSIFGVMGSALADCTIVEKASAPEAE